MSAVGANKWHLFIMEITFCKLLYHFCVNVQKHQCGQSLDWTVELTKFNMFREKTILLPNWYCGQKKWHHYVLNISYVLGSQDYFCEPCVTYGRSSCMNKGYRSGTRLRRDYPTELNYQCLCTHGKLTTLYTLIIILYAEPT